VYVPVSKLVKLVWFIIGHNSKTLCSANVVNMLHRHFRDQINCFYQLPDSYSQHGVAVARLTLARQGYTCFKNIYFVGNILLHSVTMGIFAADSKCLVMHAQCFSSYQLAYSPLHKQLACNLFVCLFVHLFRHTCNIGHVNYKLQFI
jgi:hypothetical protein